VDGGGSIGHGAQRDKEPTHTLGVHDEWTHVVLGTGVRLEVGDIVADPGLLGLIPPNLPPRRIPRLTIEIAGSTVVHDAAVHGPRPGPVRVDAQPGGVICEAQLNHSFGFGTGTEIVLVNGHRGALLLHPYEPRQLLARLASNIG